MRPAVLETTDRTEALLDGLLLLAAASGRAPRREPVDLGARRASRRRAAAEAAARGVHVRPDLGPRRCAATRRCSSAWSPTWSRTPSATAGPAARRRHRPRRRLVRVANTGRTDRPRAAAPAAAPFERLDRAARSGSRARPVDRAGGRRGPRGHARARRARRAAGSWPRCAFAALHPAARPPRICSTCAGVNGAVRELDAVVVATEQVRDVVHPLVDLTSRARRSRRGRAGPARSARAGPSSGRGCGARAPPYEVAPEREGRAREREDHQGAGDRLAGEAGEPALHQQPRMRFRSLCSGAVAASSASRISGCSRVCSCSPIWRLARTSSSASPRSGPARGARTPVAAPRPAPAMNAVEVDSQVARELEPDLSEHLAVAAGDGVARQRKCIERRVQAPHAAVPSRVPRSNSPRRTTARQNVAIGCSSSASRPSSSRSAWSMSSPRIVRPAWRDAQVANVHQLRRRPRRSRGRQPRVALGDLEVADHRIGEAGDPPDLLDPRLHAVSGGLVLGPNGVAVVVSPTWTEPGWSVCSWRAANADR